MDITFLHFTNFRFSQNLKLSVLVVSTHSHKASPETGLASGFSNPNVLFSEFLLDFFFILVFCTPRISYSTIILKKQQHNAAKPKNY